MNVSDQIQAGLYVDGQLDRDDQRELVQQMCEDPAMQREVDEIQDLKSLMKRAYAVDTQQPERHTAQRRRWLGWAASAAAIVLAFVVGLFYPGKDLPNMVDASVLTMHNGSTPVILHVPEDDPAKWSEALDVAAAFENRHVRVEVLANAAGVDLLTAAHSPFAKRIRDLLKKYPGLTFIACGNSLQKLREEGGDTRLIQGVSTTPSAVEHVADKVAEGWHYIKI